MRTERSLPSSQASARLHAASVAAAELTLNGPPGESLRDFVSELDHFCLYAQNHSVNVADVSVAIHRELGTPEHEIARRYVAALLHDIGKVGVPNRILGKPAALTAAEYDVVKTHAKLGADVIAVIDHLRDLMPEILHHHERIDGNGYPCGLSGDEIPLSARVLAVADTFDAMTSDRVYRRAFNHEEAVLDLIDSAGTQLDAVVVAGLLRVLEAGYVLPAPVSG